MNEALNEQLFDEYPEWHSQPLNLSNREMDDPYLVIRSFFEWANLPLARLCLQQWLYASLHEKDAGKYVHLHALVERLTEACWLLYVERL